MNVSVLRGFCQKILYEGSPQARFCNCGLEWAENIGNEWCINDHAQTHKIEPVWFLSPNQLLILRRSDQPGFYLLDTIIEALKNEPFLVARILARSKEVKE